MARDGVSIDPICGRCIAEEGAVTAEYRQKTYYFCSPRCRVRFEHQAARIHVGELARMGALFVAKRGVWGVA